jgi:uncharacterized RDD family membrane protein YckC
MTGGAGIRYAGVVSRAIAFVTDAMIVVVFTIASIAGVNLIASTLGAGPRELAQIVTPILAVAPPLLLVIYESALWTLAGRTPGKALLGLRVTRADGRPVTLGSAVVRALVLVVVFVGALWSLVDRRHQGLHDKLARTVVIYDRP